VASPKDPKRRKPNRHSKPQRSEPNKQHGRRRRRRLDASEPGELLLKQLVGQTLFAAARESTRYAFNGVLLSAKAKKITNAYNGVGEPEMLVLERVPQALLIDIDFDTKPTAFGLNISFTDTEGDEFQVKAQVAL